MNVKVVRNVFIQQGNCCNIHENGFLAPVDQQSAGLHKVDHYGALSSAEKRYCMSFTTGSLFHQESLKLAALYLQLKDWSAVQDKVLSDNLLQARMMNTSKRLCREIVARLKTLTHCELSFLVNCSPQEQRYLLWIAVCRRYKFIADFAAEIVREHYLHFQPALHPEDFDTFFNRKSEWHPELDAIRPSTRNKLRQVLFKILRETELLTADNRIIAALLSPGLLETVTQSQGHSRDLLLFPAFESDLRMFAQ